jgi:hypothetical protein
VFQKRHIGFANVWPAGKVFGRAGEPCKTTKWVARTFCAQDPRGTAYLQGLQHAYVHKIVRTYLGDLQTSTVLYVYAVDGLNPVPVLRLGRGWPLAGSGTKAESRKGTG